MGNKDIEIRQNLLKKLEKRVEQKGFEIEIKIKIKYEGMSKGIPTKIKISYGEKELVIGYYSNEVYNNSYTVLTYNSENMDDAIKEIKAKKLWLLCHFAKKDDDDQRWQLFDLMDEEGINWEKKDEWGNLEPDKSNAHKKKGTLVYGYDNEFKNGFKYEFKLFAGEKEYETLKNTEDIFEELWDKIEKYFEISKPSFSAGTVSVLHKSRQRIFMGPPGTGKTHQAKIEAVRIISEDELNEEAAISLAERILNGEFESDEEKERYKGKIKLVQFHPGYSYNDFMETIDITGKSRGYEDKIFKQFSKSAMDNPGKNYVLIIDEINRANVSEVLGELLYGLEYRGTEITTTVSEKEFSVPDNLYIIGTMNTADRSLQQIDYAVRRRFAFVRLESKKPEVVPENKFFYEDVFNTVRDDIRLSVARGIDSEDIMPGVSYFIIDKDENRYDEKHFEYKMKYELIPLLCEYLKDGMFTNRKKIYKGKTLVELLKGNDEYYRRLTEAGGEQKGE